MSYARLMGQFRRRLRVYLTFLIVLTLTATLAYHSGSQAVLESKVVNNEVFRPIVNVSNSVYPTLSETLGEYDSIDMYKIVAAEGGQFKPKENREASNGEKLKVIILPFTHVDPGWLKTFDAYSTDTDKILTNMHSFMMKNPKMTFMWAEFVFFERWWKKQTPSVQSDVKELVKSGRLELASGSWVMTDEANSYFPVSVDNIVEGQQFVKDNFNVVPSVIWSNDPFGYSNTVPYLFREAGLKRNVINRIHHTLKRDLQRTKAIPFNWRQYFDKNGEMDVLTQILPYTHYDVLNACGPDPGSCCQFDFKRMNHWSCPGPRPVPITASNVQAKAQTMMNQLKLMSKMYEAPVMLVMHGDDFRYDEMEEWNQQHDNFIPLFDEINKNHNAEIRFGTFSDYFEELEKWYADNRKTPATLTGDFFPYQCALGDLWTGYFTTRPFYKRQGRLLHSLIRAADLLSTGTEKKQKASEVKEASEYLELARRTLSLFQHHDAITGTSKQHVMKDYSELLYQAMNLSKTVIEKSIQHSTGSLVTLAQFPNLFHHTQTKVSITIGNVDTAHVVVYNSLPYLLEDTVSIRVDIPYIRVEASGKAIKAQIEPFIYMGEIAQKSFLLTFPVSIQALSTKTYTLVMDKSAEHTEIAKVQTTGSFFKKLKPNLPQIFTLTEVLEEQFGLQTNKVRTFHDKTSGMVQSIQVNGKAKEMLKTSFVKYRSRGGAYLMRVDDGSRTDFIETPVPKMLVKGSIQQSVHLFSKNFYKRIVAKDFAGSLAPQLEYHIRVNIKDLSNTELAMRIQSDIPNPKFYSDSVGMQLLRREHHSKLSTNGNYYPMPTAAVIDNGAQRITVASNVEHGVMPLNDGMEIMLDRILNQDDGKGLGSSSDSLPLDLYPVDMQFSILLENRQNSITPSIGSHYSAHSPAGLLSVQNMLYPPITTLSLELPTKETSSIEALPCDYQLLTNRYIAGGKKLLTIFRNGIADGFLTPSECGQKVTTSIKQLLNQMGVEYVTMTNLGGTDETGEKVAVENLQVNLSPFRFLSLITI